ncbi:MAG: PEP-CTERM sorting domain-containing protein [Bacteroidales bacterium]|nr:PEP-CTERM sorting domain-containing protein [Bacteroidales bacterium]
MQRLLTNGLAAALLVAVSTSPATAQIGVLLGAEGEDGPTGGGTVPWVDAPAEVRAAAVADFVVLSQNPLNAGLVMLAASRRDGDDRLSSPGTAWNIPAPAVSGQTTPPGKPSNGQPGGGGGGNPGGGSGGGGGGGGGGSRGGSSVGSPWLPGLLPPLGAAPLAARSSPTPTDAPPSGGYILGLDKDPESNPPPNPNEGTITPPGGTPPGGTPPGGETPTPTTPGGTHPVPQTPEPGTLLLAGLGLAAIGARRWRRNPSASAG